MSVRILHGDCLALLPTLDADSIEACVTDPPYELGFMGKDWDSRGVAFDPAAWAEVFRVLKPGAHLLAFGGTRTSHRMVCAIEDAGFEIRDTICWIFGSGFPKSLDVSKAIDKVAGAEREVVGSHERADLRAGKAGFRNLDRPNVERGTIDITAPATPDAARWNGWGTALKPAFEPIILARKPLIGTVAANVLAHGVGGINIDACRVETDRSTDPTARGWQGAATDSGEFGWKTGKAAGPHDGGRWPANVVHDGSDEVLAAFPDAPGQQRYTGPEFGQKDSVNCCGDYGPIKAAHPRGDAGSAARFFYSAKATAQDRMDSKHPTVKPLALMNWLVKLITPPGGTVLDPFAGTGSTLLAADRLGVSAI